MGKTTVTLSPPKEIATPPSSSAEEPAPEVLTESDTTKEVKGDKIETMAGGDGDCKEVQNNCEGAEIPAVAEDEAKENIPPAPAPADDELISVKVKDFMGVLACNEAQVFVLPVKTTFTEFFVEVSSRFGIELGEFDIIYQDKSFSVS